MRDCRRHSHHYILLVACIFAAGFSAPACKMKIDEPTFQLNDRVLFSRGIGEIGAFLDGEIDRKRFLWGNDLVNDEIHTFKIAEVPTNGAGAAILRIGDWTGKGEIAAFTWNKRPTLLEQVDWSPAQAQIPFEFKPPYFLPIHIWLLYDDPSKSPQDQEEQADRRLGNAYIIWYLQLTGLEYRWNTRTITYKPTPAFTTIDNCDDIVDLADPKRGLYDTAALNVYVVERVFSEFADTSLTTNGYSAAHCASPNAQVLVLGKNATPDLWAHEFGHAFALGHIDHLSEPDLSPPLFDHENVMHSAPATVRKHFTEGQSFRQAFHSSSVINSALKMNGAGFAGRNCPAFTGNAVEKTWPNYDLWGKCPLLQLRLWADGAFLPSKSSPPASNSWLEKIWR